jgi:hypothetical protein
MPKFKEHLPDTENASLPLASHVPVWRARHRRDEIREATTRDR